jgi:hypothetical protein
VDVVVLDVVVVVDVVVSVVDVVVSVVDVVVSVVVVVDSVVEVVGSVVDVVDSVVEVVGSVVVVVVSVVDVVVSVVEVVVADVSQCTPVKPARQLHTYPGPDVSMHSPPLRHGSGSHGSMQVVDPAAERIPDTQAVQIDEPGSAAKVSGGHGAHAMEPGSGAT